MPNNQEPTTQAQAQAPGNATIVASVSLARESRRKLPPELEPVNAQVFVFGHKLSAETQAWLETEHAGSVRIHKVFCQIEKQNEHVGAALQILRRLRAQGADLSGNTTTYMTVVGLSTTTLALAAVLTGALGRWPRVLNLIQQTDDAGRSFYAPSPELPFIELNSLKNNSGRASRAASFDGVETYQPQDLAEEIFL